MEQENQIKGNSAFLCIPVLAASLIMAAVVSRLTSTLGFAAPSQEHQDQLDKVSPQKYEY